MLLLLRGLCSRHAHKPMALLGPNLGPHIMKTTTLCGHIAEHGAMTNQGDHLITS